MTTTRGRRAADALAAEVRAVVPDVEVRAVDLDDPSDYEAIFARVSPLSAELEGREVDVLLSAGTPQMQTIWVILVKAGFLRARMLKVIPPAFVPTVHPRAIKEVTIDVEGFPEIRALRSEVTRLRAAVRETDRALVAVSERMGELLSRVARVAPSSASVLVQGETGSGKELVARAIHGASPRSSGPFVAESCGAFDEGVLASELFGHEAGAFTGAQRLHRGLFEQAHGGTLFLDEIGETTPRVQAMLLRVLDEGVLRRVGGERRIRVDVRVVAATHRDLDRMVEERTFRKDLYYRLRGIALAVPPLRERGADIPHLVERFYDEATSRAPPRITRRAMDALLAYAWPGNVRELRAEVHRWMVLAPDAVDLHDLSPEIRGAPRESREPQRRRAAVSAGTLREAVEAAELAAIERALDRHDGNLLRTAKELGIERGTLKRKLRTFGLYPHRD